MEVGKTVLSRRCEFNRHFSDPAFETLLMMTNKLSLILLLVISLNVRKVWSQCTVTDFCSLRSTRGISANNASMARRSMSMTCQRTCSLHPGCVAMTYDSTSKNCELHEAGTGGTHCMTLENDERSFFGFIKHPERSCPKVSCVKQLNNFSLYGLVTPHGDIDPGQHWIR